MKRPCTPFLRSARIRVVALVLAKMPLRNLLSVPVMLQPLIGRLGNQWPDRHHPHYSATQRASKTGGFTLRSNLLTKMHQSEGRWYLPLPGLGRPITGGLVWFVTGSQSGSSAFRRG